MSDSKSYSSFRSAFPPTNETQDENHAFSPGVIDNSFSFSEKTIRMAFIRCVFKIKFFLKNIDIYFLIN